MAAEMASLARRELRSEQKASVKEKIAEKQAKFAADCEQLWSLYNREQPTD